MLGTKYSSATYIAGVEREEAGLLRCGWWRGIWGGCSQQLVEGRHQQRRSNFKKMFYLMRGSKPTRAFKILGVIFFASRFGHLIAECVDLDETYIALSWKFLCEIEHPWQSGMLGMHPYIHCSFFFGFFKKKILFIFFRSFLSWKATLAPTNILSGVFS